MRGPLALIEDTPGEDERIITLRGEIDVGSTPALREWLARASEGGTQSVVVDFAHVEFLAVSGLYVLCDEQARMARHRARLTVVCAIPRILQLFEVCRLADVLHVVASREELGGEAWTADDSARASRLDTWLDRYAVRSTSPA